MEELFDIFKQDGASACKAALGGMHKRALYGGTRSQPRAPEPGPSDRPQPQAAHGERISPRSSADGQDVEIEYC